MKRLHFDPKEHVYRLDGLRIPSVTQIIKPIAPDFSMVPPAVLERKRNIGTLVHQICEYLDDDDLDDASVPDVARGYLDGWKRFKEVHIPIILENERQAFHPSLRFAGTIDRLVAMPDMTRWLLDIKTADDPAPSYGVQLAGYAILLNLHDVKRATVHLRPDGTYRMVEFKNPNDTAAFMACLSLYNWMNSK